MIKYLLEHIRLSIDFIESLSPKCFRVIMKTFFFYHKHDKNKCVVSLLTGAQCIHFSIEFMNK